MPIQNNFQVKIGYVSSYIIQFLKQNMGCKGWLFTFKNIIYVHCNFLTVFEAQAMHTALVSSDLSVASFVVL